MVATLLLFKRSLHLSVLRGRGAIAHPGWYPRDHMPGNYPRTDEERRAAAIKYGMRPEDYIPYDPEDTINHAGDYPNPGLVTWDHKDPYDLYTDRDLRRNWCEPVPKQAIRYRPERFSYNGLDEEHHEFLATLSHLSLMFIFIGTVFFFFYYGEITRKIRDFTPRWYNNKLIKQYPLDFSRAFPHQDPRDYPILNYSFEPAEEGKNKIEVDNARFPFNETER
jgi:NADH dehydrogenase (ubiquinone) 1 beta subcomplex subunit 8